MKYCVILIALFSTFASCTSDSSFEDLDLGVTYEVRTLENGKQVGTLEFNHNSGYVITVNDVMSPEGSSAPMIRNTEIIGSYKMVGEEIVLSDLIIADVKFYTRWGELVESTDDLFNKANAAYRIPLPFCRKVRVEGNVLMVI